MRITSEKLAALTQAILARSGSDAREAGIVSRHLVEANLKGHDSHGVGMLPRYIEDRHKGLLKVNGTLDLVQDTGILLVADGHNASGQVMAHDATALLIDRARAHGLALMALRNCHHMGRIGTYAEQCASAGLASLNFVNVTGHGPLVAPWGGGDARYATNPIAIGLPSTDGNPPVILDFATSKVALGKVRVNLNKGQPMAPGLLLDNQGQPSTNPQVMYGSPIGAILPMGDHKGSGLALIAELFAGALTGGGTIQPGNPRDRSIVNNMLSIAFDPARLGDFGWMRREIDAMIAYVKASPPRETFDEVMVAGEPERRSREERLRDGIPIDPTTWEQILKAGESVGLTRAELQAIAA